MVGGGDAPTLKPDPAPLRFAAEQMGVALDADDWMVGDNFTDLAAARHAGLCRCFCRFGFGEPQDETWNLAIDAMPVPSETCAPTMPCPPKKFFSRLNMCIEPPLPFE